MLITHFKLKVCAAPHGRDAANLSRHPTHLSEQDVKDARARYSVLKDQEHKQPRTHSAGLRP